MGARLGILIVHGMGSQPVGYSLTMQAGLRQGLGAAASDIAWEEARWSDLLNEREQVLWETLRDATGPDGRRLPSSWRQLREFLVHSFGDALAYNRGFTETSAYRAIHDRMHEHLARLHSRLSPSGVVAIVAHSLGAHIASNYVWDTQSGEHPEWTSVPRLAALITFGCNIPLFSLPFDSAQPIQFPGPGIVERELLERSRWLNFYDRHDVLGWPLRALYDHDRGTMNALQRGTVDRIHDHEIDVGLFPVNLTPMSHTRYWAEPRLLRPAAQLLRDLLEAVPGRD